jgi:hypothetical protein
MAWQLRFALGLVLPVLFASTATPPSTRAVRLLHESERQLRALRSTGYAHQTEVDEVRGSYVYDCSGFLGYALQRVDPAAYAALPVTSKSKKRPLAQDFFTGFERQIRPWSRVLHPRNLKPGDVVAWLKAPESDSHNTGHVMLVREHAYRNPERADEILVPIIDSTMSPHAEDSRVRGETGLGKGLIGILVDAEGRPLAFRWRGGQSRDAVATRIALGRLE